MIVNDIQLEVAKEQLGRVERALASLRAEVNNPANLAIFSEGYVEQIELLKAEIDDYVSQKGQQSPDVNGVRTAVRAASERH